jgi:filamentous hemagglutinin
MKVELPTSPSELGHIFRNVVGHVLDTPENRQLLLSVANDESARLESDQYGNVWAAKTFVGGRQVWIQIRGSKIIDAGINAVARDFNRQTGMKKL